MIQSIKNKLMNSKLSISGKIIVGYCIVIVIAGAIVGWVASSLIGSSKLFTSCSAVSNQLATVTLPHNNVAFELISRFTKVSELFSKAVDNKDREFLEQVQRDVRAIGPLVRRSIPSDSVDSELQDVLNRFGQYAEEGTKFVSEYLEDPESVNMADISRVSKGISALKEHLRKFQSSMSEDFGTELNEIVQAADELSRQNRLLIRGASIFSLVSLVIAVVISLTVGSGIVSPIKKTIDMVGEIAEGDLTVKLDVKSRDETGDLARSFNMFVEKINGIITEVAETTNTLSASSEQMSAVSTHMASSAKKMKSRSVTSAEATEEMSSRINAIATATEEMSVVVDSVSSTAVQMSQNMNRVAASIEEISTAINDVARSAQEGSGIAGEAMQMSNSATDTMSSLGEAAREIGEVTELIKQIAEQTNLLALNATIEAASAGDAGKGFAVVANEIKELANQSAQAAEDIAMRIERIQGNTEEAVKAIGDVSGIISKINESSMLITQSVEQQTITANEISGNVQQANTGVNNIASSIAELSGGAKDVAESAAGAAKGVAELSSSIQEVSESADESSSGAEQVSTSADELAKIATQIQKMVGKFKVERA
jgi:methyl-accepting chemotaxis protein